MTILFFSACYAIGGFFGWVLWQIVLKPYFLRKKIRKMKPGDKFAAKVDGVEKTYSVFVSYPEWERIYVRQEFRNGVKYFGVIYYSQITKVL